LFFLEFRRKNCAEIPHLQTLQTFISRWEVQCLFHFPIADTLQSLKWNILNALQHKGTKLIRKVTSAFISEEIMPPIKISHDNILKVYSSCLKSIPGQTVLINGRIVGRKVNA